MDISSDMRKMQKGLLKSFGPMALLVIVANLVIGAAILGGGVWLVVTILKAMGVL